MTTTTTRNVEIFTAGCPVCEDAISLVKRIACDSCNVEVHDMNQPDVARQAKQYGIHTVPAVVVDGTLADCCGGGGLDEALLRKEGIGQKRT